MKQTCLAFAIALLLGLCPIMTADAASGITLIGDVNRDSTVDTTDARLLLQAAVGKRKEDAALTVLGDLNQDGRVDTTDARLALQTAVGFIQTSACKEENVSVQLLHAPSASPDWATIGQPAIQWIASSEELRAYRAALPERLPDDFFSAYTQAFFDESALLLTAYRTDYPIDDMTTHIWKNGAQSLLEATATIRSFGDGEYVLLAAALPREQSGSKVAASLPKRFAPRPQEPLVSEFLLHVPGYIGYRQAAYYADTIASSEELALYRQKFLQEKCVIDDELSAYLESHDAAFFSESCLVIIRYRHYQYTYRFAGFDGNSALLTGTYTPSGRTSVQQRSSMLMPDGTFVYPEGGCMWVPADYRVIAVDVNRADLNGQSIRSVKRIN